MLQKIKEDEIEPYQNYLTIDILLIWTLIALYIKFEVI
jgi:hypothetical protein